MTAGELFHEFLKNKDNYRRNETLLRFLLVWQIISSKERQKSPHCVFEGSWPDGGIIEGTRGKLGEKLGRRPEIASRHRGGETKFHWRRTGGYGPTITQRRRRNSVLPRPPGHQSPQAIFVRQESPKAMIDDASGERAQDRRCKRHIYMHR